MRPCVRATRGSAREGVPRSAVARKKEPRATDRRARTKRREKIISAGAKARERNKNIIRAGGKKIYYSGGSEKKFWRQREHNPQKSLRTVETFIYWKELQPKVFF